MTKEKQHKNIKVILYGLFASVLSLMLLGYPEEAASGASLGVELCITTLIPSLYPFMVLSAFIAEILHFSVNKNSSCLVRLTVLFLSATGGYPIGCKSVSELYDKGEISPEAGRRIMLYCFCCSPGFCVGYIGTACLGSKKAGLIIYISVLASMLTLAAVMSFYDKSEKASAFRKAPLPEFSFSQALIGSVASAMKGITSICCFVILFSCLSRIILPLISSEVLEIACAFLLEITSAVSQYSRDISLPLLAAATTFAGLCSHFQVMPYLLHLKVKYSIFFLFRTASAALSAAYVKMLLYFIPIDTDAVSFGALPDKSTFTSSGYVTFGIFLASGLILLGDNLVIKIKKKSSSENTQKGRL